MSAIFGGWEVQPDGLLGENLGLRMGWTAVSQGKRFTTELQQNEYADSFHCALY